MAGFSGCDSSVEATCHELPRIEKEAARVVAELAPYAKELKLNAKLPQKKGRAPASLIHPTDRTGEQWLRWAEDTLRSSQKLREGLLDELSSRSFIDPLNESTLTLVNFHGFVSQKKYDRAQAALEQFQSSLVRFRGEVCASVAPAVLAPVPSTPKKKNKLAP